MYNLVVDIQINLNSFSTSVKILNKTIILFDYTLFDYDKYAKT